MDFSEFLWAIFNFHLFSKKKKKLVYGLTNGYQNCYKFVILLDLFIMHVVFAFDYAESGVS